MVLNSSVSFFIIIFILRRPDKLVIGLPFEFSLFGKTRFEIWDCFFFRMSSKVRASSRPRGSPWEIHQAGNEGMYPGLRRIRAFIYLFLDVEVVMTIVCSIFFSK